MVRLFGGDNAQPEAAITLNSYNKSKVWVVVGFWWEKFFGFFGVLCCAVCKVCYTYYMSKNLTAGWPGRKEATMATTLISASVLGADREVATSRVARYVGKVANFSLTGRVAQSSLAGHTQWVFEIADNGGNRNDLWVTLSSYGISLEKGISHWQEVSGVGIETA